MRQRVIVSIAGLALSCTLGFPALADDSVELGHKVTIDATVCRTEAAAQLIADTAKKEGTGYRAYMSLRKAGTCGSTVATGTIERVVTEFDDSKIGHTRLVEIKVGENGGAATFIYCLIGDSVEPAAEAPGCQGLCI